MNNIRQKLVGSNLMLHFTFSEMEMGPGAPLPPSPPKDRPDQNQGRRLQDPPPMDVEPTIVYSDEQVWSTFF